MSENPTPTPAPPPAPVTTTTQPTKVRVTGLERTGTGLTILGVIAAAIPLLALAFGSSIKLDTIDSVQSFVTTGVLVTAAAGVVALVATLLNLPGLGKPRVGPGVSTALSGAALITMALFFFVTVLPRVNAIQNLNNNIVPFAQTLNTNCKKPLNAITADYQKAQSDSQGITTTEGSGGVPTAADLGTFAGAMAGDAATFTTDATSFKTYAANLASLKSPDPKYNDLLANCKKDVGSTLAFLSDSSNIPTAQFVATVQAGVTKAKLDPATTAAINASIAATVPAGYSAVGLLTAAKQAAGGNLPITVAPGVPTSAAAAVTLVTAEALAVAYPVYVNTAMTQAAAATDPTLTNEGNQLEQDIKDTLTKNLAPFNVNADAVVNATS